MTELEKDEIVELRVDSIAFEGKAIAKIDGYVVFISGGVPGDLVKAKILKRKRDYAEAKVVEVISASAQRVEPRCRYFGVCGGCRWQQMEYEEQLRFKRRHVVDAFERIGGLRIDVSETVRADEIYEYRNKIEMTFSEKPFKILANDTSTVALGFHSPGRYDKTIDISYCHLAEDTMNRAVSWFRNLFNGESSLKNELGLTIYDTEKHSGLLRFLTVRRSHATGELMLALTALREDATLERLAESVEKDLPFVSTFASVINSTRAQTAGGNIVKIHFGSGYITDRIGEYTFRISPLSFFQTNTQQAAKLYGIVKRKLEPKPKILYDLYSGTGSISIFLSGEVGEVYGFELVESAVKDAERNAQLNGVNNTKFIQTDLLELFKGRGILENFNAKGVPKPDAIVLDPPRSGLHPKIAANLHLLGADKIIYVSCNPTTQARDIKEIVAHGYTPVDCQPVDMFPQTYHIENVFSLVKS